MAIYHASFQIVKRSTGRSAVAAAAYRSGERLVDERTGDVHDYSRKGGVAATFTMVPNDAPEWAHDRNQLWSAVELGEKRKDAQLARELNVALPVELTPTQSADMLREYVQASFVDKGMVADVAIHDIDSENPHAHVMLTMRSIDADGFGAKNRDWNSKELLAEWREGWEHSVNDALGRHGIDARVDHRSLEAQGIERKATVHLGPHAAAMEKRGVETRKGDLNREAENFNALVAMREKLTEAIERLSGVVKEVVPVAKFIEKYNRGSSAIQQVNEGKAEREQQEKRNKEIERSLKRSGPEIDF